jgi:hypothetical protein
MRRNLILKILPTFLFFGGDMRSEAVYRKGLISKLESLFPGCFILKNDPAVNQGVPDILILFRKCWAMLEIKKFNGASKQPNQDYYIDKFGKMSFASFIDPQTEDQVLDALQSAFRPGRKTRVS